MSEMHLKNNRIDLYAHALWQDTMTDLNTSESGEYKSHKVNTCDWNNKANCEKWRQGWADIQNEYLDQNGREERACLRSFARQGKLEKPTIHECPAIREMEARGIATEIGNYNREVRKFNSFIQSIVGQIRKLREEITEIINRENEIDKVLANPNNLAISELLLQYVDVRKEERQDWHEGAKKKSNSKDFADIAHSISYASNKGIKIVGDLNSRLEELKKIKYFISKVMPAGTGGTAGYNFDAPVIDIPAELPSFKEQIKEAKQEANDYNDSRKEEVRKTPNNSTPTGRDDD